MITPNARKNKGRRTNCGLQLPWRGIWRCQSVLLDEPGDLPRTWRLRRFIYNILDFVLKHHRLALIVTPMVWKTGSYLYLAL